MRQKIENLYTCAHTDPEETETERANRALAREIAAEGITLLVNRGVLPLDRAKPVALYGNGSTNTVKGGSGSGEVNERYHVSIYEGLTSAGYQLANRAELERYDAAAKQYRKEYEEKKIAEAGFLNFRAINMSHLDQGFHEKEYFALDDTCRTEAETCIYVIGRMSGEGADRRLTKGDYFLSDTEVNNLHWCGANYANVILVLNAGGPIDLTAVDDIDFAAVLAIGMPGEEGGNAFADVISGKVSPSGRLTTTWARDYRDIPYSGEFGSLDGNPDACDYKEDIFVGYRYFGRFGVTPRFYFGQGLSYTAFEMTAAAFKAAGMAAGVHAPSDGIRFEVNVKNTGSFPGRAVAQIYMSAPEGRLVQPESTLVGFGKTKELQPGESETLRIDVPYYYMASFDEENACDLMEAGRYIFFLGEHAGKKKAVCSFTLEEDVRLGEKKHICPPEKPLELLRPSEKKKDLSEEPGTVLQVSPSDILPETVVTPYNAMDDYTERAREIVNRLSLDELVLLLTGDGVTDMVMPKAHHTVVPGATGYSTSALTGKGIPSAAFCDGPAGLRFARTSVVKKGAKKIRYVEPALDMLHFMPAMIRMLGNGKKTDGRPLYLFATAFPTGTMLAQTWNEKLIEKMGYAVGTEMEEYGVNVWLAPGMNIHRNPLCGRNYEYYSEDPLLAGKCGAAVVRGVQRHRGRYATVKHFCCNNQEDRRQQTTANLTERALRDVYLKGFGIVIREAGGRALMSSYNRINGIWSGVNRDTLTTFLREECGFEGIVVTDWDGSHPGLEAEKSIDAGITMLMAGDRGQRKAIRRAIREGRLDERLARDRAARNVAAILAGAAETKDRQSPDH